MREAAYTSEYQERLEARGNVVGGSKIVHEKNRYKLECVLTGHAKRGNRHMWESMLSIECNGGEPPVFSGITISERRNVIGRGGATLEQEKRRSQIICSGEILMGGKASPFMLDLILDISYVSTTKCEVVEIKPKKTRILDSHAIMDGYIYIS